MPLVPTEDVFKKLSAGLLQKVIDLTGDKKASAEVTDRLSPTFCFSIEARWTQLNKTYGLRQHFEEFDMIRFVMDSFIKRLEYDIGAINYEFG